MLSDGSELTELSSDDDGTRSKKPKGSTKKTGYRLRNVLKPGRTTQYTAKALYDQIHDNDINMDPEYQRDVVWSEAKQIGLIDSIFRNFYVPPVIFSVMTEDDGTEKRICIDGKQRLTSIQKFIEGLIPHRDPFTNEKFWFVGSRSGPKRKLLPPQYKTLFQNKQIVCIEYSELPPDLEREVFQRVQMGMALTTAEKMQAISGPWPDLVREITNEYYAGSDGLSDNLDLDRARAREFQNLAFTLHSIDQLPEQVHGTTMAIEKWLIKDEGPSEATRAKLHDVFRIFRDLAKDKQLKVPLKKPSRVAPVEFIMIGVMIAMFKDRLSLPQLSQAIGILRTETRAVHVDVRTNSKVFKTMFQVITKQIKVAALKPTPGVPIAGSASKAPEAKTTSGPGKRKREEIYGENSSDEGGDEEEYRPKASKPRALPPRSPVNPLFTNPVPAASSNIKLEESRPTLPPHTAATTGSLSHPPLTGPSRFSRIQAAKAQAARIVNGASSVPSPSTPTSAISTHTLHPLPPRPPHSDSLMQNKNLLESALMPFTQHQPTPPLPYSTPPLPYSTLPLNASVQTQHTDIRSTPVGIPIPIPPNGDPSAETSRHRHDVSPRLSRDDRIDGGNYRGRHGYDDRRDREREGDYRERGMDRDADRNRDTSRDRDHSRSSYSTRGEPYPREHDNGWERNLDRDGRDYRRGSGYHGR